MLVSKRVGNKGLEEEEVGEKDREMERYRERLTEQEEWEPERQWEELTALRFRFQGWKKVTYKVGWDEAGEAAAGASSGLKPEQRILLCARRNPIKGFKPGWDGIRFVF